MLDDSALKYIKKWNEYLEDNQIDSAEFKFDACYLIALNMFYLQNDSCSFYLSKAVRIAKVHSLDNNFQRIY